MRVLLAATICVLVLLPATVQARRPIGAADQEKVDLPEGDQAEDEGKKEEAKRKADQERQRKEEAEKAAIADEEKKREQAEKAAQKAAEAARKKKEAEAVRAKEAAVKKKAADASKRLRAALKSARRQRTLSRRFNTMQIKIALVPGAPEIKAVEEVQIDISEKLEVPDPRYGDRKPVKGAKLIATVTLAEAAEKKSKSRARRKSAAARAVPRSYRVHPLEDAGVYGFHTTLLIPGKYRVDIKGEDDKGQAIEASFNLYPGQWPPPDWEQENSKIQTSGGRRRPIGL